MEIIPRKSSQQDGGVGWFVWTVSSKTKSDQLFFVFWLMFGCELEEATHWG